MLRKTLIAAAAVLAAIGLGFGGSAIASAATATTAPPPARIGCVDSPNRTLDQVYENVPANFQCKTGFAVSLDSGTGPAGPEGPAGPPGVQAVTTVTGSAALPAIGGSWSAGHAAVKTFTLPAGTYLVTLTGDFYRSASSTATPVLQIQINGASAQLTGYTGAFPYDAAEAVGATDGVPNGLEQTAVAEGIVTVTAGASLEVDAFGYNPDRGSEGSGDCAVNATLDAVQLTPAS